MYTAGSPLGHLARLGLLHPHDLITIQQAQWVERLLHLFRLMVCQYGVKENSSVLRKRGQGAGRMMYSSYLSHGVHRSHTQLVGEIVTLPQTNAVLAL